MLFSVLGPLEVREADASLPLGGPRQRSVLALLLLDAGRVVAADRVVTQIWGEEPPGGARDSLYTYVSNLRGVVGRERIVRVDGGYSLVPTDDDEIDAHDVELHLAEARRKVGSDPSTAIGLIDRSLTRWRGRPYEGFEDLASVAPEAARIDELRLRALEDRIDAELRTGITPEVGDVEMLTTEHPYRERFWELLARVLYRAGRQADALRALSQLRKTLADDLGLDPSPSVARLEERILVQDPALDTAAAPPTNLPASSSSFVGRVDDVEWLESLVHEHRLVTVTGPGGSGKTRLAIEVAAGMVESFPDGVWLVDLAQVADPAGVGEAVVAALRLGASPIRDQVEVLLARLRPQASLLVFDNCEQVAEEVGRLAARLLAAAPDLRVLATSRRALGGSSEVLLPLGGLGTATGSILAGDAERLFEARAAAVQPGFELDDSNGGVVTDICRHLDGMPLAIELAAARADTQSSAEIDRHLRDRFRLLAEPQADRPIHRSLLASLDWSYELLGADDRSRFDQLGVFEGPFTAAATIGVLDAPSELDAVDALRRLVTASLIQVVPGSTSRYRLLETMRLYARSHLHDADRWTTAVDRHDRHYRNRCRELRDPVFGRGRTDVRVAVEAELTDYEVAFDRFLDGGRVDSALEMAWPLGHVWLLSGKLERGVGRLERLIAAAADKATRARADALAAAAFLLMYVTRYDPAIAWADEAIEIYRSIGDEQGVAYALARRGHLAFSVGDVPTALAMLQESLETCDRIGYDEGTAWPLTLLAQARLWGGDESDEVRHMLEEGRLRFIAIGDTFGQMHANMFIPNVGDQSVDEQLRFAEESIELADLPAADPLIRPPAFHNLAFGVWNAGERERAVGLNRIAARSALEMGATVTSGMAFFQAGLFAGVAGDAERAAVLYGAGERHFVMQLAPFHERQLRPGIDAASEALGDERYRQLDERGRSMTVEEATEFLLDDSAAV